MPALTTRSTLYDLLTASVERVREDPDHAPRFQIQLGDAQITFEIRITDINGRPVKETFQKRS